MSVLRVCVRCCPLWYGGLVAFFDGQEVCACNPSMLVRFSDTCWVPWDTVSYHDYCERLHL